MSAPHAGSWSCDFARDDGTGGFVRLELRPDDGTAWYWAYLVGPDTGLIVVRDHEVPLPRAGLEIRTDGLWAELICETPGEHWSFGLEAFGLRLDDPADALAAGGEIGERIAVGLDIEWEVDDGPAGGAVRGDVLVGQERIAFEGPGIFECADSPTDWWRAPWQRAWPDVVEASGPPSAIVPLGRGARLVRSLSTEPPGWSERLELS